MNKISEIYTFEKQLGLSNLANGNFELLPEPVSNDDFLFCCLKEEIEYREQKARERRINCAECNAGRRISMKRRGF